MKIILISLFFGTIGTAIGGIIGISANIKTNKILSFILEFAAGLMMAVICFELIPEAINMTNTINIILGIMFGVIIIIFFDNKIKNRYNNKNNNSLLKTGCIIGIGLAIHNFPEGLAIGAGFSSSENLGISLAIAIARPDSVTVSIAALNIGMLSLIFFVRFVDTSIFAGCTSEC